jgi:pimeloyl-ACP methyl ester carboxylesterase
MRSLRPSLPALLAPPLLACLVLVGLARPARAAAPEFHDCTLGKASGIQARCASLVVPENYRAPGGQTLALHIALVPARGSAAEPLVVLAGGPGQAAEDLYAVLAPAFEKAREHHDLLLIDQRGTGRSHRLSCDFPDDAEIATPDLKRLEQLSRECLASLNVHTEYYTTSVAVEDLETVRASLGLAQMSVYAASYGTRLAQQYIRHHGERVRAVILDGAVPPGAVLGASIALDADRAIALAFERCARNSACHAAFPALAEEFAALKARLAKERVALSVPSPETAAPTPIRFGLPELAVTMRLMSYSAQTVALVPLLIHQGYAGHLEPLAAQLLYFAGLVDDAIAYGLNSAVACSEDLPLVTPQARARARATLLGESQIDALEALCRPWPRGQVDADLNAPLNASVPALILAGEADPVTPPAYAYATAQGFKDALIVIVPAEGHGQLGLGCAGELMARFLASGRAQGLDASCLKAFPPPPFFLDASGPAP